MLVAIPEAPETSSAGSSTSGSTGNTGRVETSGQIQPLITSNTSNASLHSKLQEIRGESSEANTGPGGNAILLRRVVVNETNGSSMNGVIPCNSDFPMMDPLLQDHAFQQQLIQLKQEQELQHQMLLQRYQAQRQQLAQAHEKQLQQRLKEFWEHKRRQDEERDRLEALKKKDKHEQSAVASSEVKQKLQGFLLNKKQREAAMGGPNTGSGMPMSPAISTNPSATNSPNIPSNSSPPFRTWSVVQASRAAAAAGGGNQSELECPPGSSPFQSHPYRRPHLASKYDDDFPLRKTASEPNLLKMKLKQRVLERRSSPLVRRKDRSTFIKRRSYLAMDGSGSAGSTPDSGPNSPPINCGAVGGTPQSGSGSGGGTPHDEGGGGASPYGHSAYGPTNSVCDLTLYSSPSLPNISLGKPIPSSESKLAAVSETEVRCPIGPQAPIPVLPFYPPSHGGPLDPAEIEVLYQSGGIMALASYQAQVHAAAAAAAAEMGHGSEVSGQRLGQGPPGRIIHRPLGRTQSAPLPLGHPMLVSVMGSNGTGTNIPHSIVKNITQGQGSVLDQHQLLRQHIRQTVLTRVGSRGQVVSGLNRAVSVEEDSGEEEQRESAPFAKPPIVQSQQSDIPNMSNVPPRTHGGHHHHVARPLSRALSSPLVALGPSSPQDPMIGSGKTGGTGLAFDSLMLKHQCLCGDNSQHPEHPGRLQSIWARLQETGLISMCERIRTRKATLEEIQSCHSEAHTLLFGTNPLSRQRLELSRFPESSLPIKSLVRLPCNGIGVDSDTAWNELHTPSAARMAAGCVLELAYRVATGDLRNGFAIVRPPGHHAEIIQAMGFCFFNSVAIAARQLRQRLQLEKILLVDWDVHHGNGTQQIFYDDPHVLYLSIHRHDDGNFFPGTGGPTECGIDDGMGFNVNIPWSGSLNPPMGDAEYLAAFRSVVMPIAQDFQPEIILVSCGFDAANGHPPPLGGYVLSPACFGYMTQQLMTLAGGKVVLALEGGYDLPAICDSAQECVKALLGEPLTPISEEELLRPPCSSAVETLMRTIAIQTPHWPCIKHYASSIPVSALMAASSSIVSSQDGKILLRERVESETVSAMASLSMQHRGFTAQSSTESQNPPGSGGDHSPRIHGDMNEDSLEGGRIRGNSEEPMDQDDESTK